MSDVPSSFSHIQIEGLQFRDPASEALFQAMSGTVNGTVIELFAFEVLQTANNAAQQAELSDHASRIPVIEDTIPPVGTTIQSMLTEIQFQSELNVGWILAAGQDVTGSKYQIVTGNTHVPDLRGIFLRGKNNGRAVNSSPDSPLGTLTSGSLRTHTHPIAATTGGHTHRLLIRGYGGDGGAVGVKVKTSTLGPAASQAPYGVTFPVQGESVWFDPKDASTQERRYSAFSSVGSLFWLRENDLETHNHPLSTEGPGNEVKPKTVHVNTFIRIN